MSEYGLNMIDLIPTHLDHYWGPSHWFDALKSVPVLDFWNGQNNQFPPKLTIFKHFGNSQDLTLELISVHQTNNGLN